MTDILCSILFVVGTLFNLFSGIGLLRLPDAYNRLQASTKAITFGMCSILLGVAIKYGLSPEGVKALLAIIVIFFTATVSSHTLARGTYRFGIKPHKKTFRDDYNQAVNQTIENEDHTRCI